jgi:ribosome-binding protein aMBF1 (putative translation factor)
MTTHQDWKPVIFSKTVLTAQPKNLVNKNTLPKIKVSSSVKLNENDEVTNIKLVPGDISTFIINKRNEKKYTRKYLAMQVGVKESVIADIENRKAIYDGNLIAKIKKILS